MKPLDKRKKLFDHWDQIDMVKIITRDQYDHLESQPIRNSFVKILRKGINDNGKTRHVLSLNELLPLINEDLNRTKNEKIKMTALYYHRDILVQENLIEEVAKILQGKRYVHYYGRTAKAFIVGADSMKKWTPFLEKIKQLILDLNPNKDPEEIEKLLKSVIEKNKNSIASYERWLKKNVDSINKIDIDIIDLFQFYHNLFILKEDISDKMENLSDLLHF